MRGFFLIMNELHISIYYLTVLEGGRNHNHPPMAGLSFGLVVEPIPENPIWNDSSLSVLHIMEQ